MKLKWRFAGKGKASVTSWFHSLGSLQMNKPHNWNILGICIWTMNECIRDDPHSGLSRIATSQIEDDNCSEQNSYIGKLMAAGRWTKKRNLPETTWSQIIFIAFWTVSKTSEQPPYKWTVLEIWPYLWNGGSV